MCFVVSTLTGINNLLCHNFTHCISQLYSKFDTLLFISLSTVVLNSKERYEMYGFQRICTLKNNPLKSQREKPTTTLLVQH